MYILERFRQTMLPIGAPQHTAGTMGSKNATIQTLGGIYRADNTKLSPELPFTLVYACKAYETTASALRSKLDSLRALRGEEARLSRIAIDDGTRQWAIARLLQVDYDTITKHSHGLFQPLSMTFQVNTVWRGILHGAPWYLNQGHYLDSGLYLNMHDRYALTTPSTTITIANDGNTANDDVVVTLEAGGTTPVTGMTITMGACQLVWSGTLAVNKTLVIDCSPARMSVLNDGIADWAALSLGGAHASPAWLRVPVGSSSMVVTRVGGGADTYLTVDFSDGWE